MTVRDLVITWDEETFRLAEALATDRGMSVEAFATDLAQAIAVECARQDRAREADRAFVIDAMARAAQTPRVLEPWTRDEINDRGRF